MSVKQVFDTSVGTVEVRIDRDTRTVAAYRFDGAHHATAAAIECWDYVDLGEVFRRQIGIPPQESSAIAAAVQGQIDSGTLSERIGGARQEQAEVPQARLRKAGLLRRYVAVVLDSLIVLSPVAIVLALTSGSDAQAIALYVLLSLAYYVFAEALAGATVGKGIVRIRVVDEYGRHPTPGAAVVRNLLRPVDALFGYGVGAVFALTSPLGQRLGDRAAHTVVVRG